jgi:1-pyrroline-5-carboxylate dehydrogenase
MNLPRVTYSNTGEDFSGVHAHLDAIIPEVEARLLGKVRPASVETAARHAMWAFGDGRPAGLWPSSLRGRGGPCFP